MTILEAFTDFTHNYLEVRQYSKETIDGYWWVIRSYIQCNGNTDTQELTLDAFNKWVLFMKKKQNTYTTIMSNISRIRIFVDYLNLLDLCPLSKSDIRVPKKRKTLPKYVTPETVEILIQTASNVRDRAIVAMLFSTGMRSSELRNLQREHIDGMEVSIHEGKGMRDRTTYMDERTRELLDVYFMTRFDRSHYVFVTSTGRQLGKSTLRAILNTLCKKAGLEHIHPHMFRHGIATYLLQQGMNLRMIQKFLGHSDLATTEQYLHVKDIELKSKHQELLNKDA